MLLAATFASLGILNLTPCVDCGQHAEQNVLRMLIQINHQPDATIFQFIILTFIYSQHFSGDFPPIIRSSMTVVAVSGFTFVSWW
jgi:hypothetical protein